jgi:hypothetical protein
MQALMDLADKWLPVTRIELTVFSDNARAIKLYERFGFEPEGTPQGQYALRDGAGTDTDPCHARIRPKNIAVGFRFLPDRKKTDGRQPGSHPRPEQLLTIAGVPPGHRGRRTVRKPNRKDLLLVVLDEWQPAWRGVFTRNRSRAAPVIVCKQHLARPRSHPRGRREHRRGQRGYPATRASRVARETCAGGSEPPRRPRIRRCLPLSTGVIMEPLRSSASRRDCRSACGPFRRSLGASSRSDHDHGLPCRKRCRARSSSTGAP